MITKRLLGISFSSITLTGALLFAIIFFGPSTLLSCSVDPGSMCPCAYHIVLNPFRDKGPEKVSEALLSSIRAHRYQSVHRCFIPEESPHIREMEDRYPLVSWRLVNRRDLKDHCELQYCAKRGGSYPSQVEVYVFVEKQESEWVPIRYAPIY